MISRFAPGVFQVPLFVTVARQAVRPANGRAAASAEERWEGVSMISSLETMSAVEAVPMGFRVVPPRIA